MATSIRDIFKAFLTGGSGVASQAQQTVALGGLAATQAQVLADANHFAKRRRVIAQLTDGGTAGTAIGAFPIFVADIACNVVAASFIPGVVMTASDTVFATVRLNKAPLAAPGTPVVVASALNKVTAGLGVTGTTVAFTSYPMGMSATAANLVLAVGDVLTLDALKASTGTAIGAALFASGASATVEVIIEEGP